MFYHVFSPSSFYSYLTNSLTSMHCVISRREKNYCAITVNSSAWTFWGLRSGKGLACKEVIILHTMKVTFLFRLLVCSWLYDRRDILFICIIFGQLGRLEMRFSILFFFGSEASISLLRQELKGSTLTTSIPNDGTDNASGSRLFFEQACCRRRQLRL